MRPFRSVLLRRLVATALVAAVGVSLVPTASASSDRLTTLRAILDDAVAFEAALAAAQSAQAAPLAAFARAYANATGEPTTAAAIERMLGADAMTGVVPPVPDRATTAPPSATSTPSLFGDLSATPTSHALSTASAEALPSPTSRCHRVGATAQPRGP